MVPTHLSVPSDFHYLYKPVTTYLNHYFPDNVIEYAYTNIIEQRTEWITVETHLRELYILIYAIAHIKLLYLANSQYSVVIFHKIYEELTDLYMGKYKSMKYFSINRKVNYIIYESMKQYFQVLCSTDQDQDQNVNSTKLSPLICSWLQEFFITCKRETTRRVAMSLPIYHKLLLSQFIKKFKLFILTTSLHNILSLYYFIQNNQLRNIAYRLVSCLFNSGLRITMKINYDALFFSFIQSVFDSPNLIAKQTHPKFLCRDYASYATRKNVTIFKNSITLASNTLKSDIEILKFHYTSKPFLNQLESFQTSTS